MVTVIVPPSCDRQTDALTDRQTDIHTTHGCYFHSIYFKLLKGKKKRKRIYIAPFIYYVYLKALRHGSHSFTCKYTMPAFPSYEFTRWRHL